MNNFLINVFFALGLVPYPTHLLYDVEEARFKALCRNVPAVYDSVTIQRGKNNAEVCSALKQARMVRLQSGEILISVQ